MKIPLYYAALLVVTATFPRTAATFAFVATTPLLLSLSLSTTGIRRSGMPQQQQQQKQQRLHHLFGYLDDIASDTTSSSSSSSSSTQHELLAEDCDPAHDNMERFDEYMAKAEEAFARAQSRMEHMRDKEAKSQKAVEAVQERMK